MRIIFALLISLSAIGQDWRGIDFASVAKTAALQTDQQTNMQAELPSQGNSLPETSADILLRPADWNISAAKYGVKPGDRLIMSGNRLEIEFHDLQGTAENPIIITALAPIVINAINPGARVVQFINCQYVRLTGDPGGTGAANIKIDGGGQGVDFRDLSLHVEADHLDVTTGYSGLNAKTDPTCDPRTWRGNFVLDGVYFHHNSISTKTGEAIYIGESHYNTVGAIQGGPCASGQTTAQEHEVRNVIIEYNTITTSGADAIQVGAVPSGTCWIRYNTVNDYGSQGARTQNAGIILNPGTVAEIYGNTVNTGTGFGLQLQGPGGSYVHNNLLINCGTKDGGAVMQVNYMPNGKTDRVVSNTFLNTSRVGLEYYGPVDFQGNILNTKIGVPFYKLAGAAGKITTKAGTVEISGDPSLLKLDAAYAPTKDSPAWSPTFDAGAFQSLKIRYSKGTAWESADSLGIVKVWLISADGQRIRIK